MGAKYEYCARGIAFGILAILLEITFFTLYCVLVNYGTGSISPFNFPFFNNTNFTNSSCCFGCALNLNTSLILVGLGLVFTTIRCTSFSSLGFILFLMAITVQWTGLVLPWLFQAALEFYQPQYIYMNSAILCDVMYAVIALSIAYGVLVGIVSRVQGLIVGVVGSVLYAVNRVVVIHWLYISDLAGSMTVYMFGAFYGLAILAALLFRDKNWCCICKCERNGKYTELLGALIAVCMFVIYVPEMNASIFPADSELRHRALLNTYFCITGAIIMAYATSSFVTPCCKLNVIHVICGTIGGAVIVAAVAPLIIQIWGAILLGAFAGFSIVILLRFMKYITFMRCDLHGIFWAFGFAGFAGGVASAVMAAIVYDTNDEILTLSEFILIYPAIVFGNLGVGSPRTAAEQGGYQMLGVVISGGIAIAGGLLVGFLIRWIGPLEYDEYFCDSTEWRVCCDDDDCCNRCEKIANACDRVTLPPI